MLPVKLGVSSVNCFIKSSYLSCNSLYQASKRPSISILVDFPWSYLFSSLALARRSSLVPS